MMHGPDHALRSQFKVGMKVYFGRSRGEQTLGEIVKMNPKKAKVKQLESRGTLKDHRIGTIWTVPFSLMKPAEQARGELIESAFASVGRKPVGPPVDNGDGSTTRLFAPVEYNPFAGLDNLFMEALAQAYSGLSPENLACDGEASMAHINKQRAYLNRVIRGCELALNRRVDEGEVYAWLDSKRAYERQHKAS